MAIAQLKELEASLPSDIYFTDQQREILSKTSNFTEQIFIDAQKAGPLKVGGHGRDHWNRVAFIAGNMASLEKIDPFLPVLTGLNHDIGRVMSDERAHNKLHGKLSAETIADFIDGLKIAREQKDITLAAIEDHPFLNHEVRENDVVKLLMDADRIDGMGANMIVRAAAFEWQKPCYADLRSDVPVDKQKGTIFHGIEWVKEWYDMLWTDSARIMAKPRIVFMDQFKAQYLEEAQFADRCATRIGF